MKISYLAILLIATLGVVAKVSAARPEVPNNYLSTDAVVDQKTSVAANNEVSKPIPVTTQGGKSICTQPQISSYFMNTYE